MHCFHFCTICLLCITICCLIIHKVCRFRTPIAWSWQHISKRDAAWYNRVFPLQTILPGCYTSPVFNQHASGWCGSCYLIAVLQMLQDRLNIRISKRLNGSTALPIVELNAQIAMHAYHKTQNQQDWNPCHGGNLLELMSRIAAKEVPLILTTSDSFPWFGYSQIADDTDTDYHSDFDVGRTFGILSCNPRGYVPVVQRHLLQHGPCCLTIHAQCMLDPTLPKRNGMIDPDITGPANHVVTVLGWKIVNHVSCWIIRNSWGSERVPTAIPENVQCVSANKNDCQIEYKSWIGDPSNPGMAYLPFHSKQFFQTKVLKRWLFFNVPPM